MTKSKLYFGKKHTHSPAEKKRIELYDLRLQLTALLAQDNIPVVKTVISTALSMGDIDSLRAVCRLLMALAEPTLPYYLDDHLRGILDQMDPKDVEVFDQQVWPIRYNTAPLRMTGEYESRRPFW